MTKQTYAIVTIARGKRYYWDREHRQWSDFYHATRFTLDQRKAYTLDNLPPITPNQALKQQSGSASETAPQLTQQEGAFMAPFWVSVLTGMGDHDYPAMSELTELKQSALKQRSGSASETALKQRSGSASKNEPRP